MMSEKLFKHVEQEPPTPFMDIEMTHPCKGVKQRDRIIPFKNITGQLNYGMEN